MAQIGQNSAPMYSNSGLPPDVSGGSLIGCAGVRFDTLAAAAVRVARGMVVSLVTAAVGAGWRGAPLALPLPTFTAISATTTATTTATAPPANSR